MKNFLRLAAALVLFSNGCAATTSYVAPTDEEARAARNFKKTVAIVAIDDQGSAIPGLQLHAASAFEYWLDGRFNLVERRKAVSLISAPRFAALSRNDQAVEAGKGLGADLALFVHVKASSYLGQVGQSVNSVSVQQPSVKSDISYELFDAKTGQVVVAGSAYGTSWRDVEIPVNLQSGVMDINRVIGVINNLSEYRTTYGTIVEEAVWNAASEAATNIASYFPMDGEVLKIVSDTEVVVNIGSAYGIQPGAQLTLWKSTGQMTDPRTGLLVSPKENKATLEVVHVTGGLTCVAKTSKKALAGVKVGDKVSLY